MLIRIEPSLDETAGRYFLEIYYPADAERPFITTAPRYQTPSVAEQDILAILAAAASGPRDSKG
ncbi:MAG TPA: hypothetical protein VL574_12015 [Stellaceae bacterium]|jgi:hypothetical protein|nr:hypothetical protein [Stellaceae bacterium]